MFLLLVPSVLFLHEIEHNYFEIRPLVVLHCLGGVYCVEEVGGCLLDGMVKGGRRSLRQSVTSMEEGVP